MTTTNVGIQISVGGTQQVGSAVRTVGQDFAALDEKLKSLSAGAVSVRGAFATLGGVLTVGAVATLGREYAQLSDSFTKFTGQLRLATGGSAEYAVALDHVRSIARESSADIGAVGALYGKTATALKDLGVTQQQAADITRSVALSLKVSGASAAESSSAILQLSQAFASGALRGDEFNSVAEASPRLMQAIADGAGVARGELRKMAEQGLLRAELVSGALLKQMVQLQAESAEMGATIGGASQQISNALLEQVGRVNQATGATIGMANAIRSLEPAITGTANALIGFSNFLSENRAAVYAAAGALVTLAAAAALGPVFAAAAAAAKPMIAALVLSTAMTGGLTAALTGLRVAVTAVVASVPGLGLLAAALGAAAGAWLAYSSSTDNTVKSSDEAAKAIAEMEQRLKALRDGPDAAKAQEKASAVDRLVEAYKQQGASQDQLNRIRELAQQIDATSLAAGEDLIRQAKEKAEAERKEAEAKKAKEAAEKAYQAARAKFGNEIADLRAYYKLIADGVPLEEARLRVQLARNGATAGEVKALLVATQAVNDKEKALALAKAAQAEFDKEVARAVGSLAKETAAIEEQVARQLEHNQAIGLTKEQLSDLERARLDDTIATKRQTLAALEQTENVLPRARDEIQAQIKALEALRNAKLQGSLKQAAIDATGSLAKETAAIEEQLARQLEHNQAIGLTKEQLSDLERARLDDTIATKRQTLAALEQTENVLPRARDEIQAQIKALEALRNAKLQGSLKQAAVDAAEDSRDAWRRFTEDIERGLTDSLMRGFEAGKGFFQSLWDGIKNTFKTTVLKLLIQPLVGSAIGGFAGMAQASGVAGSASQLGTLASIANGIKTGFQILTQGLQGSLAGVTATLGGFVSQAGSFLGSAGLSQFGAGMQGAYLAPGLAGPTTAGAGGAMGAGAQFAGVLQTVGNAAAGYALNRLISGGYSINKTVDIVGQIASLFGPLYGVIGGLANRLFGRKLKEAGIQGTLTADGFSGTQYEFYKGGLLRSNKTKTKPLDAQVDKLFDDTIRAVVGQTKEYATALGLPVDAINQATLAIKVNLKGKTQAQIDAAFNKVFQDFANQLAESVSAEQLRDLALKDETVAQTLERVAVQLTGVNALFDQLGQPLLAASVAGAAAAQNLLELAGGLEALGSRLGSYYNNFYSEAERTAILTDQLAGQFKSLGIDALPQTRDEFRRLVESQDLMTESGRSTYLALIKLSDAFASITDAVQETTQAQREFLAAQLDTAALYATSTDDYLARSAYVQSGGALAVPNGLATGIAAGYLATPNQAPGGTDAVAETRALREDVRSSQAQVAALLARVNKIFSRWDADGLPATRTT